MASFQDHHQVGESTKIRLQGPLNVILNTIIEKKELTGMAIDPGSQEPVLVDGSISTGAIISPRARKMGKITHIFASIPSQCILAGHIGEVCCLLLVASRGEYRRDSKHHRAPSLQNLTAISSKEAMFTQHVAQDRYLMKTIRLGSKVEWQGCRDEPRQRRVPARES